MAYHNFAEFLKSVEGKPFLPDAHRFVEAEHRRAEAAARRGGRGRTPRDYAAETYERQLRGVLFYFYSGRKADGLYSEEFALLRPLAQRWVEMGQLKSEAMAEFDRNDEALARGEGTEWPV